MRPWVVHILTAILAAMAVSVPGAVLHWSGATIAWGAAVIVAAVIAADALRCRRVWIGPEGLTIAGRVFAWSEIDKTHPREVPIARAGLFVRLTDAARARHGLGPPRHRVYGFGLDPAPSPELAAERYDLFLRAHRARLESWFVRVSIHQLRAARGEILAAAGKAGLVVPNVAAANAGVAGVTASLVVADLDALTIELRADSIDDVLAGAEAALRTALPDAARWDIAFAGGVMVLVGPLALGRDPRAAACLDHVKAVVRSQIRGTPRAIEAMFAARA